MAGKWASHAHCNAQLNNGVKNGTSWTLCLDKRVIDETRTCHTPMGHLEQVC